MAAAQAVAPPPPGFVLDDTPPPPPGFELDSSAPTEAAKQPTARSTASPSPETHGIAANAAGAVLEPLAAIGTGMLAKPVSDIFGLAATGKEMVSPTPGGGDPAGFKREVQQALTYEPRTAAGKAVTKYNPLALLSQLIGSGAHKAGELVAPPQTSSPLRSAIGSGIEEAIQQAPGVLGAKFGGKVAEGIPGKQAALDVAKGENAIKDTTRDTAQAGGYITPSETGIKSYASGLAGKTKEEKVLSEKNEQHATRALGGEVGVPEGGALSKPEFDRLKADAGKDYDAMTSAAGPQLQPTDSFRSSIAASLGKIDAALQRNPESNAPLRGPQRLLRSFEKQTDFPTAATLKDIQKQNEWAKADFRSGRTEMGTARLGIAKQLENLFQENLQQTGQQGLVDRFKAARQRFAKIYLLERITNDATGRVDLQKLASLSDSKAYKGVLTGAFKDAADFAKSFRKAAQRSTGEAAPRLTVFDYMFGVGSIFGGHPLAALAEVGGRLAIPKLAEAGMLQNRTPSYQVGKGRRGLPYALPAAGAAISGQLDQPPQ